MIRTPEEQYLHELIESHVAPLRSEIKALRKELKMEATHQVLDLVYGPDEGQECFEGTERECYDFIKQQGGATFTYKVVPHKNKT